MNNFKIYPYQKNKYFYGKLLTVRDFELEQRYNDEKRHMLNRLMYGSGIVTGLKVVMLDEQTISIEPGIAIDNLGREIVVSSPITQKLSLIDGFDNESYSKSLYLCLDYMESGKERVHAVEKGLGNNESVSEYNRIQEGYKVLVKEDVENSFLEKNIDISYKSIILYEDEDVVVKMKHPYFVNPGEMFEVYVDIEKKKSEVKVGTEFKVTSEAAFSVGESNKKLTKVAFKEPLGDKQMNYQIKFLMTAENKVDENADIYINKENFSIKVDNEKRRIGHDIVSSFAIINEDKKDRILREYANYSIEERVQRDSFDYIYLAKIEIINVGATYVIKRVIPVPFNQYVYSNSQLKDLAISSASHSAMQINTKVETNIVDCNKEPNVNVNYNNKSNQLDFKFELPKNQLVFENIVTGTVDFNVSENFIFGKNYITEEISHGLGLGSVFVHAGIEEGYDDGLTEEERIYYGASEVFYKSEFGSDATTYSVGVLVYPKKGTFRIGLRLQSAKRGKKIRLRWWAYKNLSAVDQEKQVKVAITPTEIEIGKGQQYQFSGIVYGNEGDDLNWSVEGENSGEIDEYGLYKAPEVDGVYKIKATSKSDPTKYAVAYIAVKEESKLKSKLAEIKI
ncbi:hypothetical protein R9X47_10815 [Wukongibacter baidiensis]|uniref:hypothetical protein n=1 Tax=Wukongibacter baidiensis TaxID=1723361 RepID=UPI003D7F2A8F